MGVCLCLSFCFPLCYAGITVYIQVVDKELLVSQLSFVRDSKETVELAAKEDETALETAAEFAKNEIKDANNGTDEVE